MAQPRTPQAQLQEAVDAVAKYNSISGAARALGMPRNTLQHRYHEALRQGAKAGSVPVEATISGAGDKQEVSRSVDGEIKTLEQLIQACEIDTEEWSIDRYICNRWGERWQVKAWLSRKIHALTIREEIEAMKREMPKLPRIIKTPKTPPKDANLLLEMAPVDFHFGKLAWGKETGHGDYDASIAAQHFKQSVMALVRQTRGYGAFARVLFVVGNDMMHIDSRAGLTTAGTQMDYDSRYQNLYVEMRKLLVWAVGYLAQEVAPVVVMPVPGNHDQDTTFTMGDSLECWFRNEPSVTVANAPTQRKYYEHGRVMLLFTHGDKGKRSDYPLLMATEQPEMFGRTEFREIHTGHYHGTRVEEKHGIRVRILPSMTAPDAWHSDNHYVGNVRASEAFVWHPEMGLMGTALYTVTKDRA